ncbi:hypothetical protein ABZ953_11345 [Streptomyces sp. NPDC046465]|uniref:hypothetical protein n=1 Tax=Streptomyces sp. NPDC046465 TaxID=3155810 RepID=UPI00340EC9E0
MRALEAIVLSVLLLGILLGLLHAVTRAYRDVQIMRLLRRALVDCAPDERMLLCLELTRVLQDADRLPPGAHQPPEGRG